jgi:hypothetical protein
MEQKPTSGVHNLSVCQKIPLPYMETEMLLSCSHYPASVPYPYHTETSPYLQSHFL